jgi:hypothetical protein
MQKKDFNKIETWGFVKLFRSKARQIGFSGIELAQRGPHRDRFVHLDTKPRKAMWSYD